ncbi:MAG TPA: hypothetical protein VFI31_05690, partial [Pirellulales bacterium]|nr:hypothetical protein [Pirellulales bacterium]
VQVDVHVEGERLVDSRSRQERMDHDLALAMAAADAQPDDFQRKLQRAGALYEAGKLTDAVTDLNQVIEKNATLVTAYHYRARAYARLGKVAEANADLEQFKKLVNDPTHAPCNEAVVGAYLGDDEAAVKRLEEALAANTPAHVCLYHSACALALISEAAPARREDYAKRAIELLRRWSQTQVRGLQVLQTDRELDPLRERDDFRELLESDAVGPKLRQFTCSWTTNADRISQTLFNLSPAEQLARAKEYAALGYRPVAISVSPALGADPLTSASVWQRPIAVKTNR